MSVQLIQQSPIDRILSSLGKVERQGANGWLALCPAHADKVSSLSVKLSTDGKVLLHCHAGCETNTIVTELGLEMKDLFTANSNTPSEKPRIEATYDYVDANGKYVFQALRYRPKNFKQRRMDENGKWIWNLKDVQRVIYRLPEVLSAVKDGKTIYICEGEKDVNAAFLIGLVATCNAGGAGKWTDQYSDSLKGAKVVILPDNDPAGKEHARRVAKSLTFTGNATSIKVLDLPGLPEKGDLSDWIKLGGTKNKLELLTLNTPEWVPEKNAVTKGGLPGEYFDGKSFIPKFLSDELLTENKLKFAADILWIFRDGVYRPNGAQVISQKAQASLGKNTRNSRILETLSYIERETYSELPTPDPLFINLLNGKLNWSALELSPHDPDEFEILQLPVKYDPDAQCPTFNKYLETTLDPEVIELVKEVIGYCLIADTRFEKAVMLTGSGSNGKSVLLDVIQDLLGQDNVSNVELQELEENRFKAAGLLGKLANVFSDLDDRGLKSSSMFKVLVTGDRITAERKFGQPFEFKNYARLLFSANKLPSSRDRSYAFYRRWLIIPFEKTFDGSTADKSLKRKLKNPQELSGILNLAIKGLHNIVRNGCFTTPIQVQNALQEYQSMNDTMTSFILECTQGDPGGMVNKQTFYNYYRNWCEDQGFKPVSQRRIKEALITVYPGASDCRPCRGMLPWHWTGIKLIGDVPSEFYPQVQSNDNEPY